MAIGILAVTALCLAQLTFQVEVCHVKVKKVGCFADKTRPLAKLLLFRRDKLEEEELRTSLPRLLCDCAVLAQSRNYTYIGLQFYAECWSSSKPLPDYDRDGPSRKCYDRQYDKCKDEDVECVGAGYTNFVYKVTTSLPDNSTPSNELRTSPTTLLKTKPTSPSSPSTTKRPCTDQNTRCTEHKAFCNDKYPAMLKQCPRTCGLCK